MSTTTKRWSVEAILQRASDLGIEILLVDGNLELHAAPGVLTEKATAIFREYKQEIIDYLHSQYHSQFLAAPTRCATCGLDMELSAKGSGTDRQFYYGIDGQCYCEDHWLGPLPETQQRDRDGRVVSAKSWRQMTPQEQLLNVAQRIAAPWPGGMQVSEVEPRISLKEHIASQRPQQRMLASTNA